MYLDALTISALVDEFLDTLAGGRIQDTLSVDETGLGMEIYSYADHQRRYLYLSADRMQPRVHLVEDKLRRGLTTPKQIALLLRRYTEGGIVAHVSQPAWERVLIFDIEGPEGAVELILEPMERRSNIILVQNGIIIDSMRRVGPEDNRYRLTLPAHEYVPPPPQTNKHNPFTLTQPELESIFRAETAGADADPKRKAFQTLSGALLGFSPLLAKEVIFRAQGNINVRTREADVAAIFETMQTVLQPLRQRDWQPGIVESDGRAEAFSVYPITHMEGWHLVDSISEALARFYGEPTGEEAYTAGKKPVFAAIEEARAKLGAKLASLERSMTDDAEREVLRENGELILAYQYTLQPDQTELQAQYDADQPARVIRLNPELTPLENAQQYFNRYNKAKKAFDDVPRLIRETQQELAFIDQLETDLQLASNWPEIDDVQQELQAKGYWKGKTAKRIGGAGQSAPLRVVTDEGFVIWVGRNSRQNEMVSFKKASADDLWLHVRGVPGAHVVIRNDGRPVPESVLEQAASLAAYYSAKRGEGKVDVDVTQIKHVRKIKGAGAGMVTYRNEETRVAIPRSEKEFSKA
jgi:predicted ribosome quality control (RQC) complex YloA/Tae2 family protein